MRERPVLRYHGGKWRLAPWVIQHFPPHRIYVEPFGGAASVLMRKQRAYAEVYNDLDGEVVNVFRVLRNPKHAQELEASLRLTPFSRADFEDAYKLNNAGPVERARRTLVKSFMGFGSNSIHDPRPRAMRTRASSWRPPTAFRTDSNKSGTTPAHDWASYPTHIWRFCERLQGVVIENRPALEVMAQHDRAECLHYVDPPYVEETRSSYGKQSNHGRPYAYKHEMDDKQHRELAAFVKTLKGFVVVSGYHCDLYQELYPVSEGWWTAATNALADGARARRETLYLSPATAHALQHSLLGLDLGDPVT
jgi:DNA adenine methylase